MAEDSSRLKIVDFTPKNILISVGTTLSLYLCLDLLILVGNYLGIFFAPAGPRRHPRSPRVYTYKDKEYLLKKQEMCL